MAAPTTFLSTLEADIAKMKAMGVVTAPFKLVFAPVGWVWTRVKSYGSEPSTLAVDLMLIGLGMWMGAMMLGDVWHPTKMHFAQHKPPQTLGILGF